jgi:hypothetical protein
VSDTSIIDFLAAHRNAAVVLAAACVFVSLCLVARLWVVHRKASVLRKLVWSVLLFLPLIGWIFYGAFFHPPNISDNRAPTENSRDAYAGLGDYPPHI